MTRISSAVKPIELCDKMLLGEHREIKRVPNEIKKKLAEGKRVEDYMKKQPKEFKLGEGHVVFFYDKLKYLHERYKSLLAECIERGFDVTDFNNAFEGLPEHLYNDWTPDQRTREIVVERINMRLSLMKPKDIKYYSEDIKLPYIKLSA